MFCNLYRPFYEDNLALVRDNCLSTADRYCEPISFLA
jgi:hypothetical protein